MLRAPVPVHRHRERRQPEVGLDDSQVVPSREALRRPQRQDHREVGGREDPRHDHEVRQREADARLEPEHLQRARRLGVAFDDDEVELLERGAVGQPSGQRVAAAQQHDVALLEQRRVLGAHERRQVAEREVEPAVLERRADRLRLHLHRLDAHARRLRADGGHDLRQELVGADVAHVQREAAHRARRVERVGLVQRGVEQLQRRVDLPRELLGAARRRDAAGCAHEQRVVQREPQPRQRVARRRLRQPEPLGGAADVARLVHGAEDVQQVQIELVQMHGPNRT